MKNNYCIIGSPVGHSLSPLIYNSLYKLYDITNCVYKPYEVNSYTLNSFIERVKIENIRGFNVTMPLKTDILSYLTYRAPGTEYGANTITVSDNNLTGYSTDAQGFFKSLKCQGRSYKDCNIVFLGCGAVTRALIADAIEKKAKKITVLNRTVSKIEDLTVNKIIKIGNLNEYQCFLYDCDILINTTPMGMRGIKATMDYTYLSRLPKTCLVCDLIYEPRWTPLLTIAKSNGNPVLNGLDMLIWQAFYAFDIYFKIFPNKNDFITIKKFIQSRTNQESI